jgi:hypothetical protein
MRRIGLEWEHLFYREEGVAADGEDEGPFPGAGIWEGDVASGDLNFKLDDTLLPP